MFHFILLIIRDFFIYSKLNIRFIQQMTQYFFPAASKKKKPCNLELPISFYFFDASRSEELQNCFILFLIRPVSGVASTVQVSFDPGQTFTCQPGSMSSGQECLFPLSINRQQQ